MAAFFDVYNGPRGCSFALQKSGLPWEFLELSALPCASINIIVRAVPAFQSLIRTAELKVTPQRASTSSRICSTFA